MDSAALPAASSTRRNSAPANLTAAQPSARPGGAGVIDVAMRIAAPTTIAALSRISAAANSPSGRPDKSRFGATLTNPPDSTARVPAANSTGNTRSCGAIRVMRVSAGVANLGNVVTG
jgi:hypothetical protein